jgi:RNA polymerase sigma-70 factor (ECF subfamily)
MDHPVTDEQLLAGFLAGRQEMFEELVHRYERPLYAFICRMSGGEAQAADIFQDTFVRVFRHADSYGARSSVKAWLYVIAANVCRSNFAKVQRHRMERHDDGAEHENGGPTVPSQLEAKETGELIANAVATLPREQREVFVLKAYEEMTYPQIARMLDRPVGTVKSQMRYALRKLQGRLQALRD